MRALDAGESFDLADGDAKVSGRAVEIVDPAFGRRALPIEHSESCGAAVR